MTNLTIFEQNLNFYLILRVSNNSLFKIQNDPFCFKIKKHPKSWLTENLSLMYEEVGNLELFSFA
jgi:hypothetical protein